MSVRISMLDAQEGDSFGQAPPIGLIRLDANEVAVIPFTADATPVKIHYCEDPEIRGYARCNGPVCVLCRSGRSPDERLLLPVYQPAASAVGVLAISPSSRPGALRPQIMGALRSGRRVALFIRREDNTKFLVSTRELRDGVDDGAAQVAAFRSLWEADELDLTSVYARYDNSYLAEIPGIASVLALKGVELGDLD